MTEVTIGNATGRITAIYALCEPDYTPRYVGKTVRYLRERHKQHIWKALKQRTLPVHRWLANRLAQNKTLVIKLIEYVQPGDDWAARERYWIKKYRDDGYDLLNLTDGGEGLAGFVHTPERNALIAAKLRTGAWFDCETCTTKFWRKRSAILKGNCRFCSRPCYTASLRGVSRPVPYLTTERGLKAAAEKRRAQTSCKRGHPLSGDNLYTNPNGSRICKQCRRIHKSQGKNNG